MHGKAQLKKSTQKPAGFDWWLAINIDGHEHIGKLGCCISAVSC